MKTNSLDSSGETRRSFIIRGTASIAALSLPLIGIPSLTVYGGQMMTPPKNALVLWYSQTGNTQRCGRVIAQTLEDKGILTRASDYRDLEPSDVSNYDMIVAGSPVYYYEVPSNFRRWLATIPSLVQKPVASFVTFGGEGGNQFNTALSLLELLADKGGIPLCMDMFGNMSTFAITWSTGNVNRVLKHSHKPDCESFKRIRHFAESLTEAASEERPHVFHKKTDFREWIKGGPSIWGTKLMINQHTIDKSLCVECGICTDQCPTSAIDLSTGAIDSKACIACLACVNNCPEQAVIMEFMHKRVYGYKTFIKQQGIHIQEPDECPANA